jgi:hypothetical protein
MNPVHAAPSYFISFQFLLLKTLTIVKYLKRNSMKHKNQQKKMQEKDQKKEEDRGKFLEKTQRGKYMTHKTNIVYYCV